MIALKDDEKGTVTLILGGMGGWETVSCVAPVNSNGVPRVVGRSDGDADGVVEAQREAAVGRGLVAQQVGHGHQRQEVLARRRLQHICTAQVTACESKGEGGRVWRAGGRDRTLRTCTA